MKTLTKALGAVTAVMLLAAGVFVVNLVWFRPFSLNLFYEKVFVTFMLQNPEALTSVGIAEQFGYRAHNAHLNDASQAKVERDFATWRAYLADLNRYDPVAQSPDQLLSTRVLAWFIGNQLEGERFSLHDYPVNQLFGVQNMTPDFLINQHRIDDRRGAEDYIARLGEVGRKFNQVLEGLALRETKGIVPPRFVIERVLAEMRAFSAHTAGENPLHRHFVEKVATLADVPGGQRGELASRCADAIEASVRPAYRRLIAFFEGQLARAGTDDGVWRLPDGADFYAWRLRSETTTRMTPDEVHALGLAEVARLEGEMTAILRAQSQLPDGETPGRALARLAKDARFLYPNTDEGRAAALTDYARMVQEQVEASRNQLGLLPKAKIEVQRVPAFKEATAPAAYYNSPAMDATRPGVFFANLRDMAEVPRFGMRTLAVHEGVPGHHYQIAIAQERPGGPTFRKLLPFTAYQEGWALYAEWLAVEMGLYKDDPFGNLGRLQSEMFRAVRLVVDTGLHAKRWTRRQAIDYMIDKTGIAEGEVVSEIERYIVEPGQACAYMVGMLRIRAARQRAEQAFGARWDVQAKKDFHDLLLRGGALPLEILDEEVDAWVATRARG